MKFIAVLLCLISSSVAFTGMRRVSPSSSKSLKMSSVFDDAVKKWSDTYPAMYSIGWGPTPLAERWNGRHAMFGWIALVFTGYAKSHGLIPNADVLLDTKEWYISVIIIKIFKVIYMIKKKCIYNQFDKI